MLQKWRKRWMSRAAWLSFAAVSLLLLISAAQKKDHKACKGIEVTFRGDGSNFFIEEKGVADLLKANGLVIGQPAETINLRALEEVLKKDKWIADAQLFFDNSQMLHAIVEEKIPVARIFTGEGTSFYIDSACKRLPLSEKLSVRIPMFTNFPSDRSKLSRPDSELLASAKELAMFIQADDFWKAQAAQIDITPEGFEMIPTVGNHVVELGQNGDWQQKFDRLFSFYKEVWTKVGFEKYERIDVRFDGQVVATLKRTKPALADSAKVRMAYKDLFTDGKKDNAATAVAVELKDTNMNVKADFIKKGSATLGTTRFKGVSSAQNAVKPRNEKTTVNNQLAKATGFKQPGAKKDTAPKQSKPEAVKTVAADKQQSDKKVPKAVMKKPVSAL